MKNPNDLPDYIFIVGLPKSGTKLVKGILESSKLVHITLTPETYFVGRFLNRGVRHEMHKLGDFSDDNNVRKLILSMYSNRYRGTYWKLLANGYLDVPREVLLDRIWQSDRSDKALYEAMMRTLPGVTESSIVGDKTPANLFHVPTLLRWFPRSKIIHTLRDPRAVYYSQYHKFLNKKSPQLLLSWKPGGKIYSTSLIMHVTIAWLCAARLHFKYAKLYPDQYYLSQFENLVRAPEQSLRRLCKFLGIEVEPAMLQPIQLGSSFTSGYGNRGFDKKTLTRWVENIDPRINQWFIFWMRRYLRMFDYLQEDIPQNPMEI